MPEHDIPGIGRSDMEQKLKETITAANEKDELLTINWDKLLLPQQMIQNERTKQAGSSVEIPSWPPLASAASGTAVAGSVGGLDGATTPKKRKSTELHDASDDDDQASQLPWRKRSARNVFEDRLNPRIPDFASRLSGKPHKYGESLPGKESSKSHGGNNSKRQRRVGDPPSRYATFTQTGTGEDDTVMRDVPDGPIVGRSSTLEKKYFRLTAPPNPDTVRPLPILRQTLDLLKKKWKDENNYAFICDQFKSLRQDLTVQHIKNEFTVKVYETHARIALEKFDLGEYNQCQTQLRALYRQIPEGQPMEFKAYQVLYLIHTGNRTDMNNLLADLSLAEKEDHAVKHALDVRSALALGNYHRFFRLFLDCPNMGAYLMDGFVERERIAALANICRVYVLVPPPSRNLIAHLSPNRYKPSVKVRFISEELGFESDHQSLQFFNGHNAEHLLESTDDGYRVLTGKAGAIFETAKNEAFRRVDIRGQM